MGKVMPVKLRSLDSTVPMPMATISWKLAAGYMVVWRSCFISSSTSRLSSSGTTVASRLCRSMSILPMGPPIMLPAIRP